MLPMNKLVEDIAIFMEEREKEKGVVVKTEETLRSEVVLFANDLSEKYKEHVSVELVDSLIVSYCDSLDKVKDEKESTLS